MILKIVCIRDTAADVFGMPNFVASLGGALRSFGDEVNRKEQGNQLNGHPEDFILYELGEYDDSTAVFKLLEQPRQLARAVDLVK